MRSVGNDKLTDRMWPGFRLDWSVCYCPCSISRAATARRESYAIYTIRSSPQPPSNPAARPPPSTALFLAQIRGDSMQPTLHDGQWCLFAKGFSADTSLGKLCLVRELDPAGLTAWTVKKLTGIQLGGDERLTLQLDSLNPAYAQRQVVIDASSDTAVEAVLREALSTLAGSRGRARA